MKRILFVVSLLGVLAVSVSAQANSGPTNTVTVTRGPGGSVKTPLSSDIAVNKDSSLIREWITIHDSTSPLSLVDNIGVKTVYERGRSSGQYNYTTQFSVQSTEPVSAFEVRFLLFDLWGNHLTTLSMTEVTDLEATKFLSGTWNVYSEDEVSKYYASIAFVSRVRTKAGRV